MKYISLDSSNNLFTHQIKIDIPLIRIDYGLDIVSFIAENDAPAWFQAPPVTHPNTIRYTHFKLLGLEALRTPQRPNSGPHGVPIIPGYG